MFNFKGCNCVACHQPLKPEDDIVVCPDCGAPYHRACYEKLGRCQFEAQHGPDFEWQPSPEERPAPEPEPQGTPHDQAPGAETDTYCRVCGQKNAPGAAICENCGAPLGRGRQSFTGPYLDPNDKLDGISLADWAAYMGPSAPVYLLRFKQMALTGRKVSFSLSALLFGPLYFFYRKMWKPAIASGLLFLLCNLPSVLILLAVSENPLFAGLSVGTLTTLTYVASFVDAVARIGFAMAANHLYRRDAGPKIARVAAQYAGAQDRQLALNAQGGVSPIAVTFAIAAFSGLCWLLTSMLGPNVTALTQFLGMS